MGVADDFGEARPLRFRPDVVFREAVVVRDSGEELVGHGTVLRSKRTREWQREGRYILENISHCKFLSIVPSLR